MGAGTENVCACSYDKIRAYIRNMNWKQKLKWKIITLLIALSGILFVCLVGKSKESGGSTDKEILKKYAVRENEKANSDTAFLKEQEQNTSDSVMKTDSSGEPCMRVLLMTDGYESYFHKKVLTEFQGEYELIGNERKLMKAGEQLELGPDSPLFLDGELILVPQKRTCRLKLLSLNRSQGNPQYRGSLIIRQEEKGFLLINEVSMEDYLCGVVPSEMPASYPVEALKAQAVCARTYACVQLSGSKLADFGADVDDSVSFQVYQNCADADASDTAVRATAGQVLLSEGKPITAYYFSTSHGKTSTDEVWEASAPSSYLKSVECTFDAEQPWFRWETTLSVQRILENVQKKFPKVNRLENLEILEKGEGEAVLNLALNTDDGIKELHSEYEIRSVLAPFGSAVTRQDGSVIKGGALLPSAYFSLEVRKDEKGTPVTCFIKGGGYGHGVGMSQNGAKGMADNGKNYKEILLYFYKNVNLGNIKDIVNSKDSCYSER